MDIDVVYNRDCIEVLKGLGDNSIDAIVTDPPYNLGFMGKKWDKTGIAFNLELWEECLRVIKPGGNLLSFGGTRTYHRMVCAIEDAGFEIRDCIMWVYGSGFPKSLDISKAIDKRNGTHPDKSQEFASYIKARRLELNIGLTQADECVCNGTTNYSWFEGRPAGQRLPKLAEYERIKELLELDTRFDDFIGEAEREIIGRHPSIKGHGSIFNNEFATMPMITVSSTPEAKLWEGYGTGLKPAYEPIVLTMKPLDGTFAENCLKWGVGGLNIDGCRIPTDWENDPTKRGWQGGNTSLNYDGGSVPIHPGAKPGHQRISHSNSQGRFPANFIHDGSQAVMDLFPAVGSYLKGKRTNAGGLGDSGSAARFFYCAKSSKRERGENNGHPTVKPLALMEYLVKLVTRPGHIVLDPFIGSGTTAMACVKLGRHYIGCELDKGYYDIAIKRIDSATHCTK